MNDFPCTGCGQCCLKAQVTVATATMMVKVNPDTFDYIKEVAAFPYKFDDAGRCENHRPDNSCAVYNDRPDICSIKKVWEKFHSSSTVSLKQYYFISAEECNKLITQAGLDKKYLIDLNKIGYDGKE